MKKWKNCILSIVCLVTVLASSLVFEFESDAAEGGSVWNNVSFDTDSFRVVGFDNYIGELTSDREIFYPSGTVTLRAKIPIAEWEYPVTVQGDYLRMIFAVTNASVNYITSEGIGYVDILSANVLCGSQSIPLAFNGSSTDIVFDMSEWSAKGTSYNIHDFFYVDYYCYYELYSGYENGEYLYYPDMEFSITTSCSFIQFGMFDDSKTAYNAVNELKDELTNSGDEDSSMISEFQSSSSSQSNSINDLNEQNETEKVDIDTTSSAVDSYIDSNAVANYGVVLSTFTNNGYVLQMMLIVLALVVVSYVLFGKR